MNAVTLTYGNAYDSKLPFHNNLLLALECSERLVVTNEAFAGAASLGLGDDILPMSYLYHNAWGCAYPKQDRVTHATWQAGPQDLAPDLPLIQADQGQYPYRIDAKHNQLWIENCFGIMRMGDFRDCAGLFADDWRSHVRYWGLTPEEQAIVWPNGSNRDLTELEKWLRTFATLCHKGPQGILCNGPAQGYRSWEDVGKWISKAEVEAGAKAGDVLIIYGIHPSGTSWGKVEVPMGWPEGTSFRTVFRWARDLANTLDLGLALGYVKKPTNGYNSQCCPHFLSDPKTWETV